MSTRTRASKVGARPDESPYLAQLRERLAKLHPADIAYVLEALPPEERRPPLTTTPDDRAPAAPAEASTVPAAPSIEPQLVDWTAITTIVGGTVGGYITYAGAHRLLDRGTVGPENLGAVTAGALNGIAVTGPATGVRRHR